MESEGGKIMRTGGLARYFKKESLDRYLLKDAQLEKKQ